MLSGLQNLKKFYEIFCMDLINILIFATRFKNFYRITCIAIANQVIRVF